jgi:hypothetical protein
MTNLFAPAVSVAAVLATDVASAQGGSMMNGGHRGGSWMPFDTVLGTV